MLMHAVSQMALKNSSMMTMTDKNVRITDGFIGLSCLDMLVGCLGCVRIPDEVWLTDGVATL